MSWLSQGLADIGNLWNSQPGWAKGLEIGAGALATGGLGLAAFAPEAIGLAAGDLGGIAGAGEGLFGGGAATTGGIDAFTTGAAVDAAGAGGAGAGGLAFDASAGLNLAGGLPTGADIGLGGGAADASPFAGLQMSANPGQAPVWTGATPPGAIGGGSGGGIDFTGGVQSMSAPVAGLDESSLVGLPDAPTSPWSLSGIGSSLTKGLTPMSALGAAAGIGGLGYNIYQGQQQKQQLSQLESQIQQSSQLAQQQQQATQAAAQPELAMGMGLQQYLTSDTLPQNAQSAVSQWIQQQKSQITQGYATRGMSADPNQNSALATDLANVDAQAQTLTQQLQTQYYNAGTQAIQSANQLIASGLNAASISAQLPIQMQQLDMQLSQQTSAAIASFAKGLGGTGSGQQFTLQPAQAA
jgi:hypothetical protein